MRFVVSNTSLSGGTDDYVATNAEIATAYEKFNDTENVDLSLLICGPSQTSADATGDTKATVVMDIATARKDCVAFISPARADVVGVANAVTQTQNVVSLMVYHHQVMLLSIVVTNICTTDTMMYSDLYH